MFDIDWEKIPNAPKQQKVTLRVPSLDDDPAGSSILINEGNLLKVLHASEIKDDGEIVFESDKALEVCVNRIAYDIGFSDAESKGELAVKGGWKVYATFE